MAAEVVGFPQPIRNSHVRNALSLVPYSRLCGEWTTTSCLVWLLCLNRLHAPTHWRKRKTCWVWFAVVWSQWSCKRVEALQKSVGHLHYTKSSHQSLRTIPCGVLTKVGDRSFYVNSVYDASPAQLMCTIVPLLVVSWLYPNAIHTDTCG